MRGPADADPGEGLGIHDAAGEREHVLLARGLDEERGAVAPGGRQVPDGSPVELVRDLRTETLARDGAVSRHREQRGVVAPGLEAERGHPPARLAVVEALVLEILEQVAREPQLGGADGPAARQLERERRLPVVQHEPVVLAERPPVPSSRSVAHRLVGDDRELERVRRRTAARARAAR